MKNLDNPLTIEVGLSIFEFNEHHGTRFKTWGEVADTIGHEISLDVKNLENFNKAYKNWCIISESPLAKALHEESSN
jgi:hypothetical protein